jgi:hypothetical protein
MIFNINNLINLINSIPNIIYIYVLKLEDNKYYIEKTHNPKFRLDSYFKYQGS